MAFELVVDKKPISKASLAPNSCKFNGELITSGQTVDAYSNSSVLFGQSCIPEHRQCIDGILSGNNNFATCAVDAPSSCLFNGQTIESGQFITAYQNSSTLNGDNCISEVRNCNDGKLSGTFSYASCEKGAEASCLFNGSTILSGDTVTGFKNATEPNGTVCTSEARTCKNGVLSGSFNYGSCAVNAPSPCLFNGQTISSGQTVKAYQNSSVASNEVCASQDRLCVNGALSGSFAFGTCAVEAPKSCIFNGRTLASGEFVQAFQSSTVPFSTSCVSQNRQCNNGALSGDYSFGSCNVSQPASCLFDGKTIASGESLIAYVAPSVAFGSSCASENITCTNGNFSGKNRVPFCTVDPAPVERLSAPLLLATALDTQARISWPVVAGASNYILSRSEDNKNFFPVSTISTNSFTDTGLKNGVEYFYSLVAVDAAKNQGFPSNISVTPVAVGQPGYGLTRLLLQWNAVPNATYKLSRDDYSFCPAINVNAQCYVNSILYNGTTELKYLDTVIISPTLDGHSYNYNLDIKLSDGTVTSRQFYFDSIAYNALSLAQVQGGIAIYNPRSPANSLGTYTGYTVYRDDGNGGTTFTKIGSDVGGIFIDKNVVSGKTYCYAMQFTYKDAGFSAPTGSYSGKSCFNFVESELTAKLVGNQLTLSWGLVADASFNLVRKDQTFCPLTSVSALCEDTKSLYVGTSLTSFQDTVYLAATLEGHSYLYTLNITLSNGQVITKDFYFDSMMYSALGIYQVAGALQISNPRSPANSLGTYTGFTVYRNDGNGGNVFTKIGVDNGTGLFNDTAVISGNTYCYAVQYHYSGAGSSAPSGGIGSSGKNCVTYLDTELTGTLNGNNLVLKWGAVNKAQYTLKRFDQSFCPTINANAYCSSETTIYSGNMASPISETVVLDSTLSGHSYIYTLNVILSNGIVGVRTFYFDSGAYNAIGISQGADGIAVMNSRSPANSLGTYSGYSVYRDNGDGGTSFTKIGDGVGGYFLDKAVQSGRTYCYAVQFHYTGAGSSAPMGTYAGKTCISYANSNLTGGLTQ